MKIKHGDELHRVFGKIKWNIADIFNLHNYFGIIFVVDFYEKAAIVIGSYGFGFVIKLLLATFLQHQR